MTTALPPNTVSKLFYFDNRIRSFYEKHNYKSVPFDGRVVQEMIETSRIELSELFNKIWDSSMWYHLLDKYNDYRGNVFEFFMCFDSQNRQLLTSKGW